MWRGGAGRRAAAFCRLVPTPTHPLIHSHTPPAAPAALKRQLVELQGEVAAAHERLHLTQARVEQNLQRISELKEEPARLGDAVQHAQATGALGADAELAAGAGAAARLGEVAPSAAAGVREEAGAALAPAALRASVAASRSALAPGHASRAGGGSGPSTLSMDEEVEQQRRRGLYSSLEMEEELKNHWCAAPAVLCRAALCRAVPCRAVLSLPTRLDLPRRFAVSFTSKLGTDTLIPFDLFGQAWVLFRDEAGNPACVLDECAHRACPLSTGTVVDGQIACPYHGWRYNGKGECTKMPSTVLCRGVAVSALLCAEQDGFVWVWPGWEAPTLPLPTFTRPPEGYRIHAGEGLAPACLPACLPVGVQYSTVQHAGTQGLR